MDAVADLRRFDGRVGEEGLRAKNALGFAAPKLRAPKPGIEGDETAHKSLRGSLVVQPDGPRQLSPPAESASELRPRGLDVDGLNRQAVASERAIGCLRAGVTTGNLDGYSQ